MTSSIPASPPRLMIIIGSTRPGRLGLPIAEWFTGLTRGIGTFDVEVADLAEINLPFLDEPKHPMLGEYQHDHTKAWSARVDSADAFVLVTPEYNFSMTAPVKNAFDYLAKEWAYKPLGLVSYGAISGGLRAAQQLRQVATALNMMPLPQAVALPFARKMLTEDGRFAASESAEHASQIMLEELRRWTIALRTLRAA